MITKYGRIGAKGRENVATLDSEERARKELEKLVRQKRNKGYVISDTNSQQFTVATEEEVKQVLCMEDRFSHAELRLRRPLVWPAPLLCCWRRRTTRVWTQLAGGSVKNWMGGSHVSSVINLTCMRVNQRSSLLDRIKVPVS